MPKSRRTLLLSILASLGAGSVGAWYWKWRQPRASIVPAAEAEQQIIRRIVDLLIPRDETPGGLDFSVDRALCEEADRDPRFGRLLSTGCRWLDEQAGKQSGTRFVAMVESEQHRLLTAMSSEVGADPSRFFWTLRERAYARYYTDPRSWAQLGLTGTPQPGGFPDYAEAPKPPA